MSLLKNRTQISDVTAHIDEEVTLFGWVDTKRDHGKLTFVDLRDRTGKVQCVGYQKLGEVTPESVLKIVGKVKSRPSNMVNNNSLTGEVEVDVLDYEILNIASELPIPIDDDGYDIKEEARLRYRYLDLRRARMKKNLEARSSLSRAIRDELSNLNFTEVETPILTKSTKEGARDFIVPSHLNPGKFYALPQSPQQYKQLLMTAGVEKYFQFARCIRAEDLRADRGFEHTQVDIEMSFVDQQDVINTIEQVVKSAIRANGGMLKDEQFPVFTYKEAIEKFGADKFDLRSEEEKKQNLLAFAWVVDFPFFKKVDKDDEAEKEDGKSGWTFTHNPFSMPQKQCLEDHLAGQNIADILTCQYDLVCNGYEVGGGSIRAHRKEILEATYKIMGYSDVEIQAGVGHMLEAFAVGTPPHGGMALGLDRLVMILMQESSLKEAIAFPMTSSGKTAVMDAPSEIEEKLLKEYSLKVTKD